MTVISARCFLGPALILAAVAAGGCTPLRTHQGYVIDADLVNSVQPGMTLTDMHATMGDPERPWRKASQIPMGRPGRPEEVAGAGGPPRAAGR